VLADIGEDVLLILLCFHVQPEVVVRHSYVTLPQGCDEGGPCAMAAFTLTWLANESSVRT
jgi:hypothetical protein